MYGTKTYHAMLLVYVRFSSFYFLPYQVQYHVQGTVLYSTTVNIAMQPTIQLEKKSQLLLLVYYIPTTYYKYQVPTGRVASYSSSSGWSTTGTTVVYNTIYIHNNCMYIQTGRLPSQHFIIHLLFIFYSFSFISI
jgi:hypothetical protein